MILIREAALEDAAAIGLVHVRGWRAAYDGIMPRAVLDALDPDRRADMWRQIIGEPAVAQGTWVALEGEVVVGFASAAPSRDPDADAEAVGELQAVYVDPDSYRRGIGTLLLAEATDDMTRHGFREATLWVVRENEKGRSFYETHGWEHDGTDKVEDIGGASITELRYRRALGG